MLVLLESRNERTVGSSLVGNSLDAAVGEVDGVRSADVLAIAVLLTVVGVVSVVILHGVTEGEGTRRGRRVVLLLLET